MDFPRIKLKSLTRPILLEWLFIIVFINLAMYGYFFIAWWGLGDYLGEHAFEDYLNSGYIHLEMILQGTLFGLMFGLINIFTDRSIIRRKPFGAIILIKTLLYTIAMLLSQFVVFVVYKVFNIVHVEVMEDMRNSVSIKFVFSLVVYFVVLFFLLNFILQVSRKFGFKELWFIIIGKYHKPAQEKRIFLFLDMKDSTGAAERLGHIAYSQLIQSCIHDLTDLIVRYKAEVYQYVGDEVVLSWPLQTGVKENNFINLFYAYEQRLKDKHEYYRKKFNCLPFFKAGADEGTITVVEVGEIKREIAYHGEVLHTAARLEKLCNSVKHKLLITQNLRESLLSEGSFSFPLIGEFMLRGKESNDMVYGVKRII
jgi:adenylate cyclase